MNDSSRDLIVRLPNWVGDVVMTLPVLQALTDIGIKPQLLGKPWINDLLAAMDIPLLTMEQSFWNTKNKLAQLPANKALLLTNSLSSALMTFLARKQSIGYKSDRRQILLKNSLAKPQGVHEIEYFWNIAGFACKYWFPELSWPESIPAKLFLPISPSFLFTAKKVLQDRGIKQPFWVLCPFAHGKGLDNQSKIWPYWRELSSQLTHHNTVVCPGPNEEALCPQLVPTATVLSGLSLGEYAAVLSLAERVIANDSGPMHIASAVNANVLGIFGVSDPLRTRPWGAAYIGSKNCWPDLDNVMEQLS